MIIKLQERKYEILLLALMQHLFIGVFLTDMAFYTHAIWPVNMLFLAWDLFFIYRET